MNVVKDVRYKTNNNIKMLFINFILFSKGLPSNVLERIAPNTRIIWEENMLTFRDKPTQEELLSQPLKTNNIEFKKAATFLSGYKGIFKGTNKIIIFFFNQYLRELDTI